MIVLTNEQRWIGLERRITAGQAGREAATIDFRESHDFVVYAMSAIDSRVRSGKLTKGTPSFQAFMDYYEEAYGLCFAAKDAKISRSSLASLATPEPISKFYRSLYMTPKNIFLSWKAVLNEADPSSVASFHRFMSAWSTFSAMYSEDSQVRLTLPPSERSRAESFEHPDAFGSIHTALMGHNEYETAVQSIAQRVPPQAPPWMEPACILPAIRVWNLDKRYKAKPSNQGQCINKHDLRGLLGCLYVVRCNLYHGGKTAGNQLDLSLCESGYQMLSGLLLRYRWR